MAPKLWFTAGVAIALSVILAPLAGAAVADPTVPGDGGQAHAGAVPGSQTLKTTTGLQPSLTVGPTTYSVNGIDVSSHDHTTYPIDWASVAASGVEFAYIKATEGTPPDPYVNPYFASDFQAAKANGLYAGAYAFGRPDLGDPVGQANVLVDKSGWSPNSTTLIPMLDLEGPYGSLTQKFDKCWNMTGNVSAWIRSFVAQVQVRIGRAPLIYTSASWWNQCTNSDASFGNYPLDIAAWTTTQPTLPAGWSNFAFWQYAPGDPSVEGDYDVDVFNGDLTALATYAGGSTFTPTNATRVLDTRDGTGTGTAAAVAAGSSVSLQVTGAHGVPASGVTAVVLNVTVTAPSATGYLTVYPDGQPRPSVSNLNFTTGKTIPNLVTVPVINGRVDFFNGSGGTVHVLADLAGYYSTGTAGSRYTSAGPTRVLDTRDGTGTGTTTAVASGSSVSLQVTGAHGVPASGVTAVVLNVTVTAPSDTGYLTVYPDGQARPTVSNLNFTTGTTIPNLVTVQVINGRVDFFNGSGGTVHVLADLAGYYSTGTAGSRYTPAGPTRVLDTRDGTGTGTTTAVVAGSSVSLQVTGANGVPASGVTAVVLNVTVTAPSATGYLTVYPDGQPRPTVSNLNFTTGTTIPNLVTVPVINGRVDFFNGSGGTLHVLADLAGYYY